MSLTPVADSSITSQNREVGGDGQKVNTSISNLGRIIDQLKPLKIKGEVMGVLSYDVKQNLEQNPNVIDPKNYRTKEDLFNAVEYNAIRRQRLSLTTIDHRLRAIRRMQSHPIFPIDIFDIQYNQFILYMDYREDIEKAGYFALQNDLQAIQMFLIAYGVKLSDWHYRLPSQPRHKGRKIPSQPSP